MIDGNYICGTKGGLPFKDAQRPLLADGLCPGELVPCSEGTTPENTICYSPEDKEENCPITDVSFLEVSGVKMRTVLSVRFF
jgi:hypothetical protein